jgi:hypothetical protein
LTSFTPNPEVGGTRIHKNIEVLGRSANLDSCNISDIIRTAQSSVDQFKRKNGWTHSIARPRVLLAVGVLAAVRPPFSAAWMSRGETPPPVLVEELLAASVTGLD